LVLGGLARGVAGDAAAQDQVAKGLALRETPTDQHLDRVASFRRGHHFFRMISFIPSMTSICSATSRLSRAFSDSRSLSRRASGTSRPPNLLRQRKKVCSVRLCFLHRALIDMVPISASRRMPMICSSVNRFFMELSLPVKGRELTSQLATRSVSGHLHLSLLQTSTSSHLTAWL